MLRRMLSRVLDALYRYDSVRSAKDAVRPIKHWLFGKSDIYEVVDVIGSARIASNPVTVVFDVGAAVGDKTITFLKSFPQAIVYCFEPQAVARERLARRLAAWRGRVVLCDYGLYNVSGRMQLRLVSYADASSLLPLQKFLKDQGNIEVGVETVTVRRLDECARDLGVSQIDLIKIDVEGVEKEVLEGGAQMLRHTQNVFVEISPLRRNIHSADHIAVFQLLHDAGFTFLGVHGDYWFSRDDAVLRSFFG